MKFRQSKMVIRESKRNLKESFMDEYVPATVSDNLTNLTVEEYFGTLMQSVVETWGLHLNTNKYSEHIALNELYDNLLESVDTLIENYKGIYGNIPAKAEVFKPEATNASEYLIELREFVEKGRNLFIDSELLSDIDSILSAIDECLYKIENLTENRKRSRKMMKESYTQRIMDVTDEMKANYPSLKDVTKIRDYGDKFNMKEIKKFKNYFKDWKLPSLKQAMEIASMLSEEYKNSKDKNGIWGGEIWTDRFEVVDIFPTMRDRGMKISPSMYEEYDMWLINK